MLKASVKDSPHQSSRFRETQNLSPAPALLTQSLASYRDLPGTVHAFQGTKLRFTHALIRSSALVSRGPLGKHCSRPFVEEIASGKGREAVWVLDG